MADCLRELADRFAEVTGRGVEYIDITATLRHESGRTYVELEIDDYKASTGPWSAMVSYQNSLEKGLEEINGKLDEIEEKQDALDGRDGEKVLDGGRKENT